LVKDHGEQCAAVIVLGVTLRAAAVPVTASSRQLDAILRTMPEPSFAV
jgi:hypothetical protein